MKQTQIKHHHHEQRAEQAPSSQEQSHDAERAHYIQHEGEEVIKDIDELLEEIDKVLDESDKPDPFRVIGAAMLLLEENNKPATAA